jgi:hypothetical protein
MHFHLQTFYDISDNITLNDAFSFADILRYFRQHDFNVFTFADILRYFTDNVTLMCFHLQTFYDISQTLFEKEKQNLISKMREKPEEAVNILSFIEQFTYLDHQAK